jgi:lysophospholipase L1-like esterase
MHGVVCRSWALWLADAVGLPYTNLAVNGASAGDVRKRQLPRLRGPYELCCLYVGVNDARHPSFDVRAFERTLADVTATLARVVDHLLMVTIPLDLGRPRAGVSVLEANRAIRRVAARRGASVVSIEGLRGWRLVLPDAVHLTALGQVALAERAALALRSEGWAVLESPAALARTRTSWPADVRYGVTGHAGALVRELLRRGREGVLLESLRR